MPVRVRALWWFVASIYSSSKEDGELIPVQVGLAVIVRLDTETYAAELRWATSMSYGSTTTTNNTAEYWDLVHGLRRATFEGYTPIHVIVDIAMIIRQLRHHRPPKNNGLRMRYKSARRCADSLDVLS